MESKERARLRAQANSIDPVFQVGKGGISQALLKQTDEALKARELIKLKVLLEVSPEQPKELAKEIAAATGSEVVQVIGGSIILFRVNPELHQPKAPAKKTEKKPHNKLISKPRINRERKPAAQTAKKPERKTAENTVAKTRKPLVKHTDKKVTEHKPLHKGRPR